MIDKSLQAQIDYLMERSDKLERTIMLIAIVLLMFIFGSGLLLFLHF